jgi:hypothetical protein
LRIQICQGLVQHGLIARILCGLQIMDYSGSREKDALLLADHFKGFGRLNSSSRFGAASFGHVDLLFDRLTFPTSGHTFILRLCEAKA